MDHCAACAPGRYPGRWSDPRRCAEVPGRSAWLCRRRSSARRDAIQPDRAR